MTTYSDKEIDKMVERLLCWVDDDLEAADKQAADMLTQLKIDRAFLHTRAEAAEKREAALREALEYARHLMWEYGFSENDLQPVRVALEAKP